MKPWRRAGEVRVTTIPRVSQGVTAVFATVAVTASLWSGFLPVAVVLDLGLFLLGCAVFAWALLRAAGRSRQEAISLGGLFFLTEGVAPPRLALSLWGPVVVQTVVALVTAALNPFSELAFGVLVPLFGLAMLTLWSATHGEFPPRNPVPVE
jgi:hypothetical protein